MSLALFSITIDCALHCGSQRLLRSLAKSDMQLTRYRFICNDIHGRSRKKHCVLCGCIWSVTHIIQGCFTSNEAIAPPSGKQSWIETWRQQLEQFNTLRPRLNGYHFADDILKCNFMNENLWILQRISLKYVPYGVIGNMAALVQIMAWRRTGDMLLSEAMLACCTDAYMVR